MQSKYQPIFSTPLQKKEKKTISTYQEVEKNPPQPLRISKSLKNNAISVSDVCKKCNASSEKVR
jgi:hypothetical protein